MDRLRWHPSPLGERGARALTIRLRLEPSLELTDASPPSVVRRGQMSPSRTSQLKGFYRRRRAGSASATALADSGLSSFSGAPLLEPASLPTGREGSGRSRCRGRALRALTCLSDATNEGRGAVPGTAGGDGAAPCPARRRRALLNGGYGEVAAEDLMFRGSLGS
jgi:hypothetical protein